MNATNSLERVLAVLDVFTEERLEWTPDDLMEELGYSRPTLYRYLKTLREAGLLMPTGNAGFTLGPRVVELDYLMRKSDPLVLRGQPLLKELATEHACTALLVRWYGSKILCVASESAAANPLSSYPRGRPMSLGRGSIARSIMAFLPRPRLIPLIERNLSDLRSVGLGNSVEDICRSFKDIRKIGYCVAFGEITPGAVGIAAPVFDDSRHPIASLCLTIAGNILTGSKIDRIGPQVRQVALQIGSQGFETSK